MKKFKKVINGVIAIGVANLPSLFPTEGMILCIYIIGLITIFTAVFMVLNKINK